jgi:hypothetical protein
LRAAFAEDAKSNDYGRSHCFAEPELDMNTPDGTTNRHMAGRPARGG